MGVQDEVRLEMKRTRWGSWRVFFENNNKKVKLLTLKPGKGISYQRHTGRSEIWYVLEGIASVALDNEDGFGPTTYTGGERYYVERGQWHQLWNHGDTDLKILEIQRGVCDELDIERIQYEWIGI